MRYEIQQYTICDGWVNTWTEYDDDNNARPLTFDTYDEALAEMEDTIWDCQKEFERGNIESAYSPDEFRIMEIK